MNLDATRRPPGDAGQITLLVIGFTAVAGLLLVVVVEASAVFLARRSLASSLDAAALAAAQSVDLPAFYAGASPELLPLAQGEASAVAADYLATHAPEVVLDGVVVDGSGSVVQVSGHRVVRLPMAAVLGDPTFTVRANAFARAPLR